MGVMRPFAMVQAGNLPGVFWPVALLFGAVAAGYSVFDHHDLCPRS